MFEHSISTIYPKVTKKKKKTINKLIGFSHRHMV